MKIEFPLKADIGDGTVWTLHNLDEVGNNLEWANTDNDPKLKVWDNLGRPLILKVEACRVLVCELKY